MRKNFLLICLFVCIANAKLISQSWSALGSGIGSYYYSHVNSIISYNGSLYAAGSFTTAGGVSANNIAKWNGSNWSSVNAGIDGAVYSMSVFNGELYAAGSFSTAGITPANNIAKWNGTTWTNVGSQNSYFIKSLAVYNGELYAAGYFIFPNSPYETAIAKWNGSYWKSVGPDDSLYTISIECMTTYNGELYAAGAYYQIGGGGVAEYYRVSKWNGSNWSSVVTIPALYTLDGALGDVYSMTVYNGELYISGGFSSIDTIPTGHIAKWNGTNWSAVGTGINPSSYAWGGDSDASSYTFVKALGIYDGDLYATGRFDSCGSIATNNIAKWNGSNWANVNQGINGPGYSLSGTDTCLFVGGWFNSVDGFNSLPANKIAKWIDSCSVAPSLNGNIIGSQIICQNSSQTYFIHEISGATSYTWIIPSGWSGYSTTNSITVTAGTTNGLISVMANNSCGSSNLQTISVSIGPAVPDQLNTIAGNSILCENTSGIYAVEPVEGASSYVWTLPQGWTGTSTTNTITATAGANSGTISVKAVNDCGTSNMQTLPVTVLLRPGQPLSIEGNDTVCAGTTQAYSIDTVVNATYYTWVLPGGWSGYSTSGSINVIAGLTSGMMSVVASNNCGASLPQTKTIIANSIPAKPTLIHGNDTACEGSSQTYFVDPVPGATGYAWDLTFGTAFGFDSTIITIAPQHSGYPDDFITVSAYNNCGNSDVLMMPVKIIQFPYQPAQIFGNRSVCSGSNQTYFIDPIPDATSYTWVMPSGWIGNSNNSSINVNVGNETDYISVRANNSCGTGEFSSLQILLDSIPPKPGIINGKVYVATGEKHGYSVDITNRPLIYNWSLNGGGNLTVGQRSNKIEIDWQTPGTYVLSVNAVNSCGVSTEQKMNIIVSGANEKDPYSLQLFPNPSTGEVYLKAKRVQDKWISVTVLSMSGQLVFDSGKRSGANDYSQLIDLDKMPQGLYVTRIIVNDQVFVKTISIIR